MVARSLRTVLHVVTAGLRRPYWSLRQADDPRILSTHATQDSAIDAAREFARHTGVCRIVVHRPDGSPEFEFTYGDEPRRA